MSPRTPTEERCPRCGTPGTLSGGDGFCPGCLLELALCADENEEPEEMPSGSECGIYQLGDVLGRGGNGIVFLARRRGSEKNYALKMLASARLAGPDELRRFRLEAESAMDLEHPHIVRVIDVGEADGAPFFVMEHAGGGSLADRMQRENDPAAIRATMRERVGIVVQVSRAVHFAHERGVLHRDIKPANILIHADGRPLVGDFGLARMLHAPSGVTMTGAALGTPAYMSPEQAAGISITTAADVFSLGAVLFHLLTGKPPFEGNSPLETLRLVTTTDAPDPRVAAPWIDRDLAMICLTALRRNPAGRYASAAVLADDLERWQAGEAVLARPLPWLAKCLRWCRRHPIAATLTATGTTAAVTLAAVFVTGSMMLREERNRALRQEAIARTNAAEATKARDESRLNSYAADIYLAFRAFDDGHLGQARKMLARHASAPGLPDLRGFEWHALTNRCRGDDVHAWNDQEAAVMAVSFSPDGKLLASGSEDGRVIIRRVPDGKIALSLPKPDAPRGAADIPLITSVTAKSGELKKLLLASPINPDEIRMRARPSRLGEVSSIAWSPDGRKIATAGLGNYVRIWSFPEGELQGLIPVISTTAAAFSADGKHIVIQRSAEDGKCESRIYQTDDLSLVRSIGNVQVAHAVSPSGNMLATIAAGGTRITLGDFEGKAPPRFIDAGIAVKRLCFSKDGGTLWGVEASGILMASWNVSDGRRTGTVFPVAGKFDLIGPLPDGSHMASTGSAQTVALQHVTGGSPAALLSGHEDAIRALACSPDGRWLATGGNDHSCRLWNANPAAPVVPHVADTLSRNDAVPEKIKTLAGAEVFARQSGGWWAGDGRSGGSLRFLTSVGEVSRTIKAAPERYYRLVPSPDGQWLGALSWPRALRLLKSGSGDWSEPWQLSSGTVGPVVFSGDSNWIVSGGDDNAITIRSVADGSTVALLRGHQGAIVDLAFTPDGRTLVSSSDDKTLRLWHTATWRDLGILHQGEVLGKLGFSADGKILHGDAGAAGIRVFGEVPR